MYFLPVFLLPSSIEGMVLQQLWFSASAHLRAIQSDVLSIILSSTRSVVQYIIILKQITKISLENFPK